MSNSTTPHFLERFADIVRRFPDRIAIEENGCATLTFAQLQERAIGLAARLRERGIGHESVVGLALPKSSDFIVAVLGCWYAKAAFLPLDVNGPPDRMRWLIDDANTALVLVKDSESCGMFPTCAVLSLQQLDADQPTETAVVAAPGQLKFGPTDALAYIIYTSGSIGRPKGVEVTHQGLVNLLEQQITAFQLDERSRSLFYLSTNFDASVSDIGTTLLAGATLCIERPDRPASRHDLLPLMAKRRITHIDLPPSVLSLLDATACPPLLRTIIIGGEVCPPEVVRQWAKRVRVVNVYGPTEATVCTSLGVCDPETWSRPLLGQPLAGITYRVLDEDLAPVETGQLFIGGVGLARGYRRQPELTATKFITQSGERLYATGDRVILHPHGEYEFLGRIDRQFKRRGQLVEPEEIEACLQKHPSVQRAAVGQHFGTRHPCLVAFLECRSDATVSAYELRQYLATRLPRWMLPQRFEFLKSLPVTSSGKIDLPALVRWPLSRVASVSAMPFDLAGDARTLAGIWQEVLGVEDIGLDEDWQELGGDSLMLLEVAALAEIRGLQLPTSLFATCSTIRQLSERLVNSETENTPGMSAIALRKDVQLDETWRGRCKVAAQRGVVSSATPRTILLTGATGFLGSRVLGELLSRTTATVISLVRAADDLDAHHRLLSALGRSHVPQRVVAIRGDIEAPQCGLSAGDWDRLSHEVDAVFHCAAQVNLVLPYAALRRPNVAGTQEVARLVCEGKPKSLHLASSLSVFVSADGPRGRVFETDDLSETGSVFGGYAQSKWAAEVWLRTIAAAVPVTIHRFGLLTGDSRTGEHAMDDFFSMLVSGLSRLGCFPQSRPRMTLDVTPIDFAAAAMVELSQQDRCDSPRCYHIANPVSLSVEELLSSLRRFGVSLNEVSDEVFRQRVLELAVGSPAVAATCLSLCRCGPEQSFARLRPLDLFQATGFDFDTTHAQRDLAASGLSCPPPTDDLLNRYWSRLLSDPTRQR